MWPERRPVFIYAIHPDDWRALASTGSWRRKQTGSDLISGVAGGADPGHRAKAVQAALQQSEVRTAPPNNCPKVPAG